MVGLRSPTHCAGAPDLVPPYGHAVRDPDIISEIDHLATRNCAARVEKQSGFPLILVSILLNQYSVKYVGAGKWLACSGVRLRAGAVSVAFRSAKERDFRGRAPCTHGRGDHATIIDSPVLRIQLLPKEGFQ
jgi:hypothetical protein